MLVTIQVFELKKISIGEMLPFVCMVQMLSILYGFRKMENKHGCTISSLIYRLTDFIVNNKNKTLLFILCEAYDVGFCSKPAQPPATIAEVFKTFVFNSALTLCSNSILLVICRSSAI